MSVLRRVAKKFKTIVYGKKYILSSYRNITMLLRATNHVDRKIIGNGNYEEEQISKVISLINEKKIGYFVDVGANIGIYSLRVAKSCSTIKNIIAIEAQIENYNQLCANIRLNGLDRVIDARNIGASNKTGVVEFLINKGSSTGTSRIKETAPSETKLRKFNSDTIAVDSLDNLMKGVEGESIFFKIDVEGHERNVLLGMENIIAKNYCILQMEILDNDAERVIGGFNLKQIDRIGCDMYFESDNCKLLNL